VRRYGQTRPNWRTRRSIEDGRVQAQVDGASFLTCRRLYSTPDMIRLMEAAAFHALQPYCEEGETTVGTAIHIGHRAACGIGARAPEAPGQLTRSRWLVWTIERECASIRTGLFPSFLRGSLSRGRLSPKRSFVNRFFRILWLDSLNIQVLQKGQPSLIRITGGEFPIEDLYPLRWIAKGTPRCCLAGSRLADCWP
jgi:hypothetical protein